MTPIFGKGVVFDASPERRKEMLHNSALRGDHMKSHARTIEREVRRMIENWGDSGEIDLLEFFAELTIYVDGMPDRPQVPRPTRLRASPATTTYSNGHRSAVLRGPLLADRGFRLRDEARERTRGSGGRDRATRIANPRRNLSATCSTFSSPSKTTMATTVLGRQPACSSRLCSRATTQFGYIVVGSDRTAPPPGDLRGGQDEACRPVRRRSGSEFPCAAADSASWRTSSKGNTAAPPTADHPLCGSPKTNSKSPAIPSTRANSWPPHRRSPTACRGLPRSRRLRSEPLRKAPRGGRRSPLDLDPLPGRRHRCVGAAFATMQIKAIFSVLLREYEFDMAQPADSYRNDHSKMVVQLARPALVRYRRRTRSSQPMGSYRVGADLDLCQGHAV